MNADVMLLLIAEPDSAERLAAVARSRMPSMFIRVSRHPGPDPGSACLLVPHKVKADAGSSPA